MKRIKEIQKDFNKIFIPVSLTILSTFLFNLIDSIFISKISEIAIAGIGLLFPLILFNIIISSSISNGISINISKAHGLKFKNRIQKKLLLGTIIILIFSISLFLILFFFENYILLLFNSSNEIINSLTLYYNIWIYTILIEGIIIIYGYTLNSIGKSSLDTKINLVSLILNIFLNYILIFGFYFIKPLGIEGAAYGTLISKIIQLILVFIILKKEKLLIYKTKINYLITILKRTKKLILSKIIQGIIVPIGILFLNILVSKYNVEQIAAFTLIYKLELLYIFISTGVAISLTINYKKYEGQKKYNKLFPLYRYANIINFCWASILIILIILFGNNIGSIFFEKKETIEIFYKTIILIFSSYLSWSIIGNMNNILMINGNSYLSVLITFIRIFLTFIITPILSNYYFGYYGIPLGVLLGSLISLIIISLIFNKNKTENFKII